MIDTSIVHVHQHGACIANNGAQHIGRSRGGLTSKIHVVVDGNGLPVQLGREQGAWANIPPKRNRKDPICFSPYLYRDRNLVERFFNKIKQCRRVPTRYDKLAANYLAFVKLACIRLWLRVYESTA
jgi:hypothetical protein